jgi:hypothetical protein
LKIIGYRISNGYYVRPTLTCSNPFIFNAITFRIDTGCDITTLSLDDALNIKLDFSKLGKPFDVLGASGKIPTYQLFNCGLSFDLDNCILLEKMNLIHISYPVVTNENAESIKNIPSLLGMDFIQRYSMRYDNYFVYLER